MTVKLAPRGKKTIGSSINKPCIVGKLLLDLTKDSNKDILFMLKDTKEQTLNIQLYLRDNGIFISGTSIGVHRRGLCYCPQSVRNIK